MVFLDAKHPVSFPLKDKHAVSEHHIAWKSQDATEKNVLRCAFQCTTWFVWNKLAASKTLLWRRQKICGCRGLLGRIISTLKFSLMKVVSRKDCVSFHSPKSYNLCLECLQLPEVKLLWQRFCHSGKRGPGNEILKKRKEQTAFYDWFQHRRPKLTFKESVEF